MKLRKIVKVIKKWWNGVNGSLCEEIHGQTVTWQGDEYLT